MSEGLTVHDAWNLHRSWSGSEGGLFEIKFFLHELGYLPRGSIDRILKLQPGEDLSIAMEAINQAGVFCHSTPDSRPADHWICATLFDR